MFVSTLSLEWIAVTGLAGGLVKPFHVSALLVIALCLLRWRPRRLVLPVMRRHAGIFGTYFLLLALIGSLGLVHEDPYRAPSEVMRQTFYAATSVFIAGWFLHLAGRRAQRLLAWTGVVTVAVLVVVLVTTLAAQHANPVALLREALARGDPDVVSYRLLRPVFRSQEELANVGANLRHKVFGALLLAVFVGLAFQPLVRHNRSSRALLTAGAAVGGGLVVLSLSRSVIVCLAVTLLLVPLRVIVRRRAAPGQALVLGLLASLALALALSPVGNLLYSRFAASGSYVNRLAAAGSVFETTLGPAALLGVEAADVGKSPHNLVLDAWLAAGLAGAICALLLLACYARVWLREVRRYLTGGKGWVLPVAQLWVIGIGVIPLVRAFTSGNQGHMIEWTAIGMFLGLTYANQHHALSAGGQENGEVKPVGDGRLS